MNELIHSLIFLMQKKDPFIAFIASNLACLIFQRNRQKRTTGLDFDGARILWYCTVIYRLVWTLIGPK
jgi:hypothetical protein